VGVLGPVEARREGRPLAIGGPVAERVLVLLVANLGAPLRVEALADAVWDGRPPGSWRNTVQSQLSRFRSALGVRIERSGDAYTLDASSCDVDLATFERLCADAERAVAEVRWADAAHQLSEALSLWRGPAFDGHAELDAVRPVAVRLDERRVDAVESLVAAHLAAGDPRRAAQAAALRGGLPLGRERLWCLRATALERCGRSADALDELSTYRRLLAEETGLVAGAEVADLEQAILGGGRAGEPRPAPSGGGRPAARPPPLPAELTQLGAHPLVGRGDEERLAAGCWAEARSGACTAMFIRGEPGAGKTRLAAEVAASVHRGGGAVRYGRGSERAQAAYQILGHALRDVPGDVVDLVGDVRPDLHAVIPHVVAPAPVGHEPGVADARTTRFHEALGRLAGVLATPGGLLLVLDDLQWAAPSELAAVERLVSVTRPAGVMVLGVVRTHDTPTEHVDRLVADLRRHEGAVVADLGGLDAEAVGRIVEDHRVPVTPVLAARLHRATGGNPLLVTELAVAATASGELQRLLGDDQLPVTSTIADLVRARAERLPDGGALLEWAALFGVGFGLRELEAATGDAGALAVLERAAAAGLVREVGPGHWEFCHGLTRDALGRQVTLTRRSRRHAAIARAIEDLGEDDAGSAASARAAYHWCEAATAGDTATALDRTIAAARACLGRLAPDEARRHVARALQVAGLDDEPDPAVLAELHLLRAQAGALSMDATSRAADAETAFAHAREAGDERLVAESAIQRNDFWTQGRLDRTALALLDEALTVVADPVARTRLTASLAGMLAVSGAPRAVTGHDPVAVADRAFSAAAELDDDDTWLAAATSLVVALWAHPAAARQTRIAAAMHDRGGDVGPLLAARWGAAPALTLGDRPTFERLARRLRDDAGRRGFHALRAYGLQCAALTALLDGDVVEAERVGADAVEAARGHPNFARVQAAQSFWAASESDQLGEILPVARAVVDDNDELAVFHAMLGLVLCGCGLDREAADVLERLSVRGFRSVPRDILWTATICAAAEITAHLGASRHVVALDALLEPYAGQLVVVAGGAFVYGAVDRFRAMLAAVDGRDGAAREMFSAAAALERSVGSVPLEARTLVWQLRTLGGDSAERARLASLCAAHPLPWARRAAEVATSRRSA
jgi:DNA-binding SARP family transcriptional activator